MCTLDLCVSLREIDNGRFEDVIHVLKISEVCSKCDFFNLGIKDERQQYRCKCAPQCIAATLHPDLISYLNWKLEWIDEKEHLLNIGINT